MFSTIFVNKLTKAPHQIQVCTFVLKVLSCIALYVNNVDTGTAINEQKVIIQGSYFVLIIRQKVDELFKAI